MGKELHSSFFFLRWHPGKDYKTAHKNLSLGRIPHKTWYEQCGGSHMEPAARCYDYSVREGRPGQAAAKAPRAECHRSVLCLGYALHKQPLTKGPLSHFIYIARVK